MAEATNPYLEHFVLLETGRGKHETIALMSDQEVEALSQEFNPESYRGSDASDYMNSVVEFQLSPLVALGFTEGKYYGVPIDQMEHVMDWANRGIHGAFTRRDHPHFRIVSDGIRDVVFPTAELLESFGVRRNPNYIPDRNSSS